MDGLHARSPARTSPRSHADFSPVHEFGVYASPVENGLIATTGAQDPDGDLRRRDWETNHALIRKVILEGIEGDGMPSNSQIAERTGLNISTVKGHLASLKQETAARFHRFRMLTDEVVMGMYRAGKRGDAKAGKLFMQFVEEWEERKRITTRSENPYADLTDEELDRQLAEAEGRPAPPISSPAAPTEGTDGPAS